MCPAEHRTLTINLMKTENNAILNFQLCHTHVSTASEMSLHECIKNTKTIVFVFIFFELKNDNDQSKYSDTHFKL